MKVYLVRCEWENSAEYEDCITGSWIEAVCATKDIAIAYIKNLKLKDGAVDDKNLGKAVRTIYDPVENDTKCYYVDEKVVLN